MSKRKKKRIAYRNQAGQSVPQFEKISIGWLVEHLPTKYWYRFLAFLIAIFVLGTWAGQTSFIREILKDDTYTKLKESMSERDRMANQLAEKDRRIVEMTKQVSQLEYDIKTIERKHKILELYGSDFWFYRSFHLRKEKGSLITLGSCKGEPCYRIVVQTVGKSLDMPKIGLSVGGPGFGTRGNMFTPFMFATPLRAGCRTEIHTKDIDIQFIVEDDRVYDLQAGVAIRDGTYTGPSGFFVPFSGCPKTTE